MGPSNLAFWQAAGIWSCRPTDHTWRSLAVSPDKGLAIATWRGLSKRPFIELIKSLFRHLIKLDPLVSSPFFSLYLPLDEFSEHRSAGYVTCSRHFQPQLIIPVSAVSKWPSHSWTTWAQDLQVTVISPRVLEVTAGQGRAAGRSRAGHLSWVATFTWLWASLLVFTCENHYLQWMKGTPGLLVALQWTYGERRRLYTRVVWSHVGLISIMGLWMLIAEELTVSTVLNTLGLTQPQSHHEAEDSPSHRGGSSERHPGSRGRTLIHVFLPPQPKVMTSKGSASRILMFFLLLLFNR